MITIETLVAATVGIVIGAGFERFLRKIESKPQFRVRLGVFEDLEGRGIFVEVENIGLLPLPSYVLSLFHPGRPNFAVFPMDKEADFPQHPTQWNRFRCLTNPKREASERKAFFDYFFLRLAGEEIEVPTFSQFSFRITLARSESILFENADLGNTLAKWMFESYKSQSVEQSIKEVTYVSRAPFYVEFLRRRRERRRFFESVREK